MAKEGLGLEITELRLGLPGGVNPISMEKKEKKRVFSEMVSAPPEKKNQVVGWPPVCSYRKKNSNSSSSNNNNEGSKMYVKVSMDGAPFLRKIDLSSHQGYSDLALALKKLFGCFGIGEVLKDRDSSEFVPIYEDNDGDWMLVGDVPWEMFSQSCKRLRIMKRSDAKGIGFGLKSSLKKVPKYGSSKH